MVAIRTTNDQRFGLSLFGDDMNFEPGELLGRAFTVRCGYTWETHRIVTIPEGFSDSYDFLTALQGTAPGVTVKSHVCGRDAGHEGSHKCMGCDELWDCDD